MRAAIAAIAVVACGLEVALSCGGIAMPRDTVAAVSVDSGDDTSIASDAPIGSDGSAASDAHQQLPSCDEGFLAMLEFWNYGSADAEFGGAFQGIFFRDWYGPVLEAGAFAGCSRHTYGACSVIREGDPCGLSPQDAGYTPDSSTAGTLRIFGGALGDSGVVVDASPVYYADWSSTPLFHPGDVMSAAASGQGDVSPFVAPGVASPGYVTLVSPAPDPGDGSSPMYTVSANADVPLAWTGGEPGALLLVDLLTFQQNAYKQDISTWIWCTFDAASGHGIVPKEALAEVSGFSPGPIELWHIQERTFPAGPYCVVESIESTNVPGHIRVE